MLGDSRAPVGDSTFRCPVAGVDTATGTPTVTPQLPPLAPGAVSLTPPVPRAGVTPEAVAPDPAPAGGGMGEGAGTG
jgi:hypothetical protein